MNDTSLPEDIDVFIVDNTKKKSICMIRNDSELAMVSSIGVIWKVSLCHGLDFVQNLCLLYEYILNLLSRIIAYSSSKAGNFSVNNHAFRKGFW